MVGQGVLFVGARWGGRSGGGRFVAGARTSGFAFMEMGGGHHSASAGRVVANRGREG